MVQRRVSSGSAAKMRAAQRARRPGATVTCRSAGVIAHQPRRRAGRRCLLLAALAGAMTFGAHGARAKPSEVAAMPAAHFLLRQRLELPGIDSFARLEPSQRTALEALQVASALELHVYALSERALIVLPRAHPAGELVLLWRGDRDRLMVRAPDGWLHSLRRELLPEVLDRAASAEHTLEPPRLEALASTDATRAPTRSPLRRGAWRLRARAHYRPLAQQAAPWALRLRLDLWTSLLGLEGGPTAQILLALALPLCAGHDGLMALDALAEQVGGTPIGWRLKVVNESLPAGRAPIWRTEVTVLGAASMPERRLGFSGLSGRDSDHLRISHQLPAPTLAGLQVVAPAALAALRAPGPSSTSARGRATAPRPPSARPSAGDDAKALRIDNQSAGAALIYVDGVLLGWVAGGETFTFAGLRPGYYRVFAVAPTGARSWGPQDLYLPGTWTLEKHVPSAG
ncbi:MAG: hypothetical protein IPL40_02590 [Proteobacteria bacterium]|nr:hypothetical protein [Pseudomonadota bacterium]